MGTSRNDPSPNTPPWRVTNAVLANPSFDVERQSVEIWRAAGSDPGAALKESLAHPAIAEACRIASNAPSVAAALSSFARVLAQTGAASLQIDLAQRAMVKTVAKGPDAARFAAEFFAEVGSYYVSRDLPGHVGARGRIANISAAITLKEEVRSIAREAAHAVGTVGHTPQQWRTYVGRVLKKLGGGK